MNLHFNMLKPTKLLPLTLIALTLFVSACGNKPTESAGGTATPKSGATAPAASSAASPAASPTAAPKQWSKAPDMTIDPNKTYQAEVTTSKGTFTIDLFAKEAPKTVNNFVFLSKEGFYNNVTFHRIIKTFMVQTGDPLGTGRGGPGYKFADELKTSHKYEPGIVAMANSGPNTNGSQFFICSGEDCAKSLNPQPNYSIFGKVTPEGMATIAKIAETPVEMGGESSPSKPKEKVTINAIAIKEK
ncbi:cyclophilin family peptidyl-prolyl cis-trans isomerase [Paenibacillus sp. V4I3]|uniref:peptidylprolyl isomerase n=1 Tax=unclassified Paenibacillus TaxID=185978 RepID=UPI00277F8B28|nr:MULTISPECIES: peptidylprolyl isomerase [unclassified Paenibacillus]MDQ0875346.1 cyclophilin family peptidyl-prolyl cis-trans isomerase [Paenibacillus sp. V4I3]MDQ0888710.1 cyclophilin family peptidyl-prolyl cis-trans isomerase [Paenibacillus sp. V4I9]